MKLALLSLFAAASVYAQTNTYTAKVIPIGKQDIHCTTNSLWTDGEALYQKTNHGTIGQRGFNPGTNILSASFTNALPLIEADSDFDGVLACGHSSITFTDLGFPQDVLTFTLHWPTNKTLPIPTNLPTPLTTVGITNPP